jgi:hypothetical protein
MCIVDFFAGKNNFLSFISLKDHCLFDTALCNSADREQFNLLKKFNALEFQNALPGTLFERILQWVVQRKLICIRIIVSICVDVGDIDVDMSATAINYLEIIIKSSGQFLEVFKSEFLSYTMIDNLTCCKVLKHIEIGFSNYFESIHTTPQYPLINDIELTSLISIRAANIPEKFMIPFLCCAVNLEQVSIEQTDIYGINNAVSANFLKLLPDALSEKVTNLTLSGFSSTLKIEIMLCENFSMVFMKLQSLTFTRQLFADTVLERILSQCNPAILTTLDFSKCLKLTCAALNSVVKHCPSVVNVNLSDCKKIYQRGVIYLVSNCKKLDCLDISGTAVAKKPFLVSLIELIGRANTLLVSLRMSCECLTTELHYRDLLCKTFLKLCIRKECSNELYSKNNLIKLKKHETKLSAKAKSSAAKESRKAQVKSKASAKSKSSAAKVSHKVRVKSEDTVETSAANKSEDTGESSAATVSHKVRVKSEDTVETSAANKSEDTGESSAATVSHKVRVKSEDTVETSAANKSEDTGESSAATVSHKVRVKSKDTVESSAAKKSRKSQVKSKPPAKAKLSAATVSSKSQVKSKKGKKVQQKKKR